MKINSLRSSSAAEAGRLCTLLLLFGLCFGGASTARELGAAQRPLQEGSHLHEKDPLWLQESYRPPNGECSPVLLAFLEALRLMQSTYFEIWQGTWPNAIEWTAAVMGSQLSASMLAYTHGTAAAARTDNMTTTTDTQVRENFINRYTQQLTAFYFGEDAFALRSQAYDDMLWVVLGWLQSIQHIDAYSDLHYAASTEEAGLPSTWYAKQFIPGYAHRARVFYDLAAAGWGTDLCGGGMTWNPRLTPYKNAVTNELYITASINMYLYFPGDNYTSPFVAATAAHLASEALHPPRDPRHLRAAIDAYAWLAASNMTNAQGLYIDGFHITGWRGPPNASTGTGHCDLPDRHVYTYNQGVLLTGLRGLWLATGTKRYLDDGHKLISSVIAATGWHGLADEDHTTGITKTTRLDFRWAGIGRHGVLEEACDWRAVCGQDAQTFKGIFFAHLEAFCAPLPLNSSTTTRRSDSNSNSNNEGPFAAADADIAAEHRARCREYVDWVRHNARAAYGTRKEGRFGMWWTVGLLHGAADEEELAEALARGEWAAPERGVDYRNDGVPDDAVWRLWPGRGKKADEEEDVRGYGWEKEGSTSGKGDGGGGDDGGIKGEETRDPNARGRGRTLETQSGGLAVLRALYRLESLGLD